MSAVVARPSGSTVEEVEDTADEYETRGEELGKQGLVTASPIEMEVDAAPAPSPPPPPRPSPPREAPAERPRVYDDLQAARDPVDDPASGPSFVEGDPPYDELRANRRSAPVFDEGASQFDSEPPFKPRRNYVKLWTWAAGIFAALALGAVAAVSYFGAPDWFPVA